MLRRNQQRGRGGGPGSGGGNGGGGGVSPAQEMQIYMPITTAATQNSTTSIPAGALVTRCAVNIEVAYDGAATIKVGQSGSTSLLQGTGDNEPVNIDLYDAPQTTAWGVSTTTVLVTVGGAPTVGSGHVLVEYSIPNT